MINPPVVLFSYNLSVMNKVGCANFSHGAAQILCQQMQQCGCNISLMAFGAACSQTSAGPENPPAQESIQVTADQDTKASELLLSVLTAWSWMKTLASSLS